MRRVLHVRNLNKMSGEEILYTYIICDLILCIYIYIYIYISEHQAHSVKQVGGRAANSCNKIVQFISVLLQVESVGRGTRI